MKTSQCIFVRLYYTIMLFFTPGHGDDVDPVDLMKSYNERLRGLQETIVKIDNSHQKVLFLYHKHQLQLEAYNTIKKYNWNKIENELLKRQFLLFHQIGPLLLSSNESLKFEIIVFKARRFYNEISGQFWRQAMEYINDTNIRHPKARDVAFQELWNMLSKSLASDLQPLISDYFALIHKSSQTAGVGNPEDFWKFIKGYGDHLYEEEIGTMWENTLGKYHHRLISYMEKKFEDKISLASTNRNNTFRPYKYNIVSRISSYTDVLEFNLLSELITQTLVSDDFSIETMVMEAEAYFVSLGFHRLSKYFWEKSSFVILTEKTSIFELEFFDNYHYKVNVKAPINYYTYYKLHQLLFQIHKYLLIEDAGCPVIFREPDFKPFHDALEAAIIMPAIMPATLKSRVIERSKVTESHIMDTLMVGAVSEFTTMSSALTMDSWKWFILRRNITNTQQIRHLWEMRYVVEDVKPTSNFGNICKMNYRLDCSSQSHSFPDELTYQDFITIVLKYQIFASLCQRGDPPTVPDPLPLHKCDFSWNMDNNEYVKSIILLGATDDWQIIFKMITGSNEINAEPFLKYFEPVFQHIEKEETEDKSAKKGLKNLLMRQLSLKSNNP